MNTRSELHRHQEEMEAALERARTLFDELDPTRANRQPVPGSWSPLQALEHLNVAAGVYQPRIEHSLQEAPAGGPPYEGGTLTGRLALRTVDPTRSTRVKAPKIFRPPTTQLTVVRVRDDFERYHSEWMRLLAMADGHDLGHARVRLPLPIPVHMSLAQAFQLHAWHIPRHVGQAERAAHGRSAAAH